MELPCKDKILLIFVLTLFFCIKDSKTDTQDNHWLNETICRPTTDKQHKTCMFDDQTRTVSMGNENFATTVCTTDVVERGIAEKETSEDFLPKITLILIFVVLAVIIVVALILGFIVFRCKEKIENLQAKTESLEKMISDATRGASLSGTLQQVRALKMKIDEMDALKKKVDQMDALKNKVDQVDVLMTKVDRLDALKQNRDEMDAQKRKQPPRSGTVQNADLREKCEKSLKNANDQEYRFMGGACQNENLTEKTDLYDSGPDSRLKKETGEEGVKSGRVQQDNEKDTVVDGEDDMRNRGNTERSFSDEDIPENGPRQAVMNKSGGLAESFGVGLDRTCDITNRRKEFGEFTEESEDPKHVQYAVRGRKTSSYKQAKLKCLIDQVKGTVSEMEQKISKMDRQMETLEKNMDGVKQCVDKTDDLPDKVNKQADWVNGIKELVDRVNGLRETLSSRESTIFKPKVDELMERINLFRVLIDSLPSPLVQPHVPYVRMDTFCRKIDTEIQTMREKVDGCCQQIATSAGDVNNEIVECTESTKSSISSLTNTVDQILLTLEERKPLEGRVTEIESRLGHNIAYLKVDLISERMQTLEVQVMSQNRQGNELRSCLSQEVKELRNANDELWKSTAANRDADLRNQEHLNTKIKTAENEIHNTNDKVEELTKTFDIFEARVTASVSSLIPMENALANTNDRLSHAETELGQLRESLDQTEDTVHKLRRVEERVQQTEGSHRQIQQRLLETEADTKRMLELNVEEKLKQIEISVCTVAHQQQHQMDMLTETQNDVQRRLQQAETYLAQTAQLNVEVGLRETGECLRTEMDAIAQVATQMNSLSQVMDQRFGSH